MEDEDRDYLMKGITRGFDIIDSGQNINRVESLNHQSAIQNRNIVTDIIKDEIKKGRYVICDDEWRPSVVSPLGLIPKSGGGYRLIHDCSFLRGMSVNDNAVTL